jgi:NitT/TauT family transport system substrate-binding protein
MNFYGDCTAALYVADRFLQNEGFIDVKYVEFGRPLDRFERVAAGDADVSQGFSVALIVNLDRGDPLVVLAGGHIGCFELVASDRVRSIRDLKGKTVAVYGLSSPEHLFLASMAAFVGLNPSKDINWVMHSYGESERMLIAGKIDAVMALPPFSQELRAKKIGRVLVNSMMDRPWSQYFCCMPFANREFARKHPVATKRWLRAHLKASDFCARQPAQVARILVDKGYADNYAYVLQTLKEIDYGKWRDYDPEDTMRFFALRLHEAGMIKSSPQKIIAQGTNWRFLNEIKREPKARGSVPGSDKYVHGG